MSKLTESMHPRSRPNLENFARMVAHPTGVRDFTNAVAEDLNLTKDKVGNLLRFSGTLFDSAKYFLYGAAVGTIVYESLIKQFINNS
jgi:hypothetical protein